MEAMETGLGTMIDANERRTQICLTQVIIGVYLIVRHRGEATVSRYWSAAGGFGGCSQQAVKVSRKGEPALSSNPFYCFLPCSLCNRVCTGLVC